MRSQIIRFKDIFSDGSVITKETKFDFSRFKKNPVITENYGGKPVGYCSRIRKNKNGYSAEINSAPIRDLFEYGIGGMVINNEDKTIKQ